MMFELGQPLSLESVARKCVGDFVGRLNCSRFDEKDFSVKEKNPSEICITR